MIHKVKSRRILLTGGGSGGHIFPLLAVTEELVKIAIDNQMTMEFYYLGPLDQYSKMLGSHNIKVVPIMGAKYRRYASMQNFLDIPRFFGSLLQAFWKTYWLMPDVVFSKGGTGALPVVFAAWFYRIPVLIHESDAAPGLTNLVSARFATRVAVGFAQAARFFRPNVTAHLGNPVREKLLHGKLDQKVAKEKLGFSPDRPLILVLGGSQGSQNLNEFIILNLKGLLGVSQVLHQTGYENFAEVDKLSKAALMDVPGAVEVQHRYVANAFLEHEDMAAALSAADLVIGRAGAGTIYELAAFGKPALLIPHEAGSNHHQLLNAEEFAQSGAAVVIEENNLFPAIFMRQVKDIILKPEVLSRMSAAAAGFFKPTAAKVIAEELIRIS